MQQRSLETRARLLEAAWEAFAERGFDAASVDEICRRAGVSKGAFYHHFESKQEIFLALLQSWLEDIRRGADAVPRGNADETLTALAALLPELLHSANKHLALFLEFWARARRDPKVWAATLAPYHQFQEFFDELLSQGVREGTFAPHDTQRMARVLVALAVGLLLQGALEPDAEDWKLTAEEGLSALGRGLREGER